MALLGFTVIPISGAAASSGALNFDVIGAEVWSDFTFTLLEVAMLTILASREGLAGSRFMISQRFAL